MSSSNVMFVMHDQPGGRITPGRKRDVITTTRLKMHQKRKSPAGYRMSLKPRLPTAENDTHRARNQEQSIPFILEKVSLRPVDQPLDLHLTQKTLTAISSFAIYAGSTLVPGKCGWDSSQLNYFDNAIGNGISFFKLRQHWRATSSFEQAFHQFKAWIMSVKYINPVPTAGMIIFLLDVLMAAVVEAPSEIIRVLIDYLSSMSSVALGEHHILTLLFRNLRATTISPHLLHAMCIATAQVLTETKNLTTETARRFVWRNVCMLEGKLMGLQRLEASYQDLVTDYQRANATRARLQSLSFDFAQFLVGMEVFEKARLILSDTKDHLDEYLQNRQENNGTYCGDLSKVMVFHRIWLLITVFRYQGNKACAFQLLGKTVPIASEILGYNHPVTIRLAGESTYFEPSAENVEHSIDERLAFYRLYARPS